MRAVTIQQPAGWAIFRAGMDVLSHKVHLDHHGRLLIHAGQKYDADVFARVARLSPVPVEPAGAPGQDPAWTFGAIIGAVTVTVSHRSGECGATDSAGCSPWAERFSTHLTITDPIALPAPVACHGKPRLWTPEPHVLAAVRRQLP